MKHIYKNDKIDVCFTLLSVTIKLNLRNEKKKT